MDQRTLTKVEPKTPDMKDKTIEEKISWLFEVNKKHSNRFISTRLARQFYRVKHPTEICAFKCMDGRIHIPLVTNTPPGIILPYRNIDGAFDLGWPLLGEDLTSWVKYGVSKGRNSLILVTYHYSKGDSHRGCAGFHYDNEEAFRYTVNFYKQVNRLFGENNEVVFPIVIGLETDTDSLVFHPQNPTGKDVVYVSEKMSDKTDYLLGVIHELYPDMKEEVMNDLIPLIQGNIAHIKETRESGRKPIDMQHREWILGVGRGFDWLHEPNTALIIGPYSPDLSEPIRTAIGIIADNMKSGRIKDDGFLVLLSSPFKENGVDENRAKEKTNFFRRYVRSILEKDYPELVDKARYMGVVVNEHTRKIKEISEN